MLALCTSPNEISLVLAPSDARWLSEECRFWPSFIAARPVAASASSAGTTTRL